MGISSRPQVTSDLAQRNGLPQSNAISGLYNAEVGLARYYRQRQNAGKTIGGVGLGGCGVRVVGHSFWKGYNQTHAYRDTFWRHLHAMLKNSRWQRNVTGGIGYVSGRSGFTTWPGGAATLSGEAIWTFGGTWTVTSAASINNLRCTSADSATPARARLFLDPVAYPVEATSDIAIVHGNEAVAGTLTWDLKYTATDTGFFAPGTGDVTGTINMNAATQGGVFTFPAGLAGLTTSLTQAFILQVACTAGTIYFEGAYFFNGDLACGMHGMDCSRIGSATGDATFTNADRLAATFTKGSTYAGNAQTFTACYVIALDINDCAQQITIANFKTRLLALADHVDTNSSNNASVLFAISPCLDEALHANAIPWNSYKQAIFDVAALRPTFCAVADFDEFIGNPDTAAEVNEYEAVPFRYSTDAAKHPTNEGAIAMAGYLASVLLA
jgi:hypothetical protein